MQTRFRLVPVTTMVLAFALLACAPGSGPRVDQGETRPPAAPKVMHMAMRGQIKGAVIEGYLQQAKIFGRERVSAMLGTSLTATDNDGNEIPMLAVQAPSLENGLWKLNPDGSMETTYQLRPGVTWHDGTPITAADFVLAGKVGSDKALAGQPKPWPNLVDSFAAPSPQTFVVHWRSTYVNAQNVFGLLPLPSHLLAESYAANPAGLFDLPYWTNSFVGTGPFKLDAFEPATSLTLSAYDGYFLGRPKIDRIEMRTIEDASALIANVLSGAVEVNLDNSNLTTDDAANLRDRWTDGTVFFAGSSNGVPLWINLANPDPIAILNPQFRKALYHALDRQSMVDSIEHGISQVSHNYVSEDHPDYRATVSSVVTYDFDLRKTAQILQGLGFTKGADGNYRDPAGQPLTPIEVRSTATDAEQFSVALISAANWSAAGLKATPLASPQQLIQDREWRVNFPGFEVSRKGQTALDMAQQMHSKEIPSGPQWLGNNRSRLNSPELDALAERYVVTIPIDQRRAVAAQIFRFMTENVYLMPTVFTVDISLVNQKFKVGWRVNEAHTSYLWDTAS